MKKKMISMLLCTGLIASMLSGCGAKTEQEMGTPTSGPSQSEVTTDAVVAASDDKTDKVEEANQELSGTISILSWYDETKAQGLLEGFNAKYPNITIDFQYSPPVQDYVEKLSTLLYSAAGPDIFYMCMENREDLIKGNYCEDLSNESYIKDGTIPASAIEAYGANGIPYAMGVDCWAGGIFYNKELFAQAGIDTFPTTWDGLLEACKKLEETGIVPIMDNLQDAATNITAALYGSEVKKADPKVVEKIYAGERTFEETWTGPVTTWKQLIDLGYIDKNYLGSTTDDIVTAFATGQTAMIVTGSWNVSTIRSINPDIQFECMPIPGESDAYYCGCINVAPCINAASNNKELAKAFLTYCASPEGLELQYKGYGGFTIAEGYTPDLPEQIADAVQGVKEERYYIPMGEWKQYTESLRLTYIQSLQDCMAGTIEPVEVGKRLDAKLAEVSKK